MKKFVVFLVLLFIVNLAYNQSITWDRTYNNNALETARSIKQTFDNGYIVACSSGEYYGATDFWILKLNEYGDTLWTKTFSPSFSQEPRSIIETDDGCYVISGYKSPTENYFDFYIYAFKIDETGNVLWEFEYPGGNRLGQDIVETYDGDYVILGINVAFIASEIILLKLNQNGQLVWNKTYSFPSIMYEINETQDSGFILIGERPMSWGQDIWVMKTDKLGDSTWTKTIDYDVYDIGHSIKQLDDGNYILAATGGSSDLNQDSYNNLLTYKLDQSGEIIWFKDYYGHASFYSSSIFQTNDDGFLTAGGRWQQNGGSSIFVFKQNSIGDSIWIRTFDGGGSNFVFEALQSVDQGFALCGYVSYNSPTTLQDAWILKLDENGLISLPPIQLNPGFQFVSSRIQPAYPDMLIVLQDILNENLDFVRNSNGETLRKIGPNWVNGIGDWVSTEGYMFKMNGNDELGFTGIPLDPRGGIFLQMGFNFISFLPQSPIDALVAVENILDNLDFVRNSNGNTLRKIGPNWVNGIGTLNPNEGYLVKMNNDDLLFYPIVIE
jgi:hypothetical protein